jgi:nitrogen fixation/metabolism regulation signal transduction histidine kinase
VIDLKAVEVATFVDMLDCLSAGIFLLDGAGRIVHANSVGHEFLAAGDMLRSAVGRLVANDPQVNQVLYEAFKSAEHGDAAIGVQGIAVALVARDGERHVAHLLNSLRARGGKLGLPPQRLRRCSYTRRQWRLHRSPRPSPRLTS